MGPVDLDRRSAVRSPKSTRARRPSETDFIQPLLDYAASADDDSIVLLSPDEAALISTFALLRKKEGIGGEEPARWSNAFQRWLSLTASVPRPSKSADIPSPLSPLLDRLQDDGIAGLKRIDVEVLLELHALLGRIYSDGTVPRTYERLALWLTTLQRAGAALPAVTPHDTLSIPLQFATTEMLENAPRKKISAFAGVHRLIAGPTYIHQGNLRILGDVPEDCVVVAEGGSCWVTGFVFGHVAVTHHCDVGQSIAGTVISRMGSIRARKALPKSFVVSKIGGVYLESAEQAELVFANNEISIAENAVRGVYKAARIDVGADVIGGEAHVCEWLQANRIAPAPMAEPVIVLRDRIDSHEYGQIVTREARMLLALGKRECARLEYTDRLVALTHREIETFAQNAIFSIFGGPRIQKKVEEIDALEGRLAFVDRILEGLASVLRCMPDPDDASAEPTRPNTDEDDSAPSRLLDDIEAEFDQLESGGRIDRDLEAARNDVKRLGDQVHQPRITGSLVARLQDDVHAKRADWLDRRETLVETIQRHRTELDVLTKESKVLQGVDKNQSKIAILERAYRMCRERPSTDPFVRQAYSGFNKLMLQYIDQRRERIRHYNDRRASAASALDEILETLRSKHHIENPFGRRTEEHTRVRARFAKGTVVCTDAELFRERQLPPASLFVVDKTAAGLRSFQRIDDRIVECATG